MNDLRRRGATVRELTLRAILIAIRRRASPRSEAVYDVPLASGFITDEALVLLALAVVAAAS
jgi:hypothetical protein